MLLLLLAGVSVPAAWAHVLGEAAHDDTARRFAREFPNAALAFVRPVVALGVSAPAGASGTSAAEAAPTASAAAAMFRVFEPAVRVRTEGDVLLIESNGLPAHAMMVGITAWQQQVPLPQPYRGANAWRVPLQPRPAATPVMIRDRFLRGAIALAANGVPIFNPQNNRGEVSLDIGELDKWGGHCGRADDYHYHVAPLHLQPTLGAALPVAVALDGYAIYGLTEPDGSAPQGLDACNGHETGRLGYHYHASKKYPFVNGGFHGVVVEREGQVDPQPRAQGVRPALTALRGARIVGFEGTPGQTPAKLSYTVNGRPASVTYAALGDGQWRFQFANADGSSREDRYRAGEGGGNRAGQKQVGPRPAAPRFQSERSGREDAAALDDAAKRGGGFVLRSPAVGADGVLPVAFTGDGASLSPPLEWSGAPAGTESFAVVMHHVDPEGRTKWYWTLYNIPADVRALPQGVQGIGTFGNNSITHRVGYAPPHSKGPGEKSYVLTVYALSAPLALSAPPSEVDRATLLAAMQDRVLGRAELKVVYTRPEATRDREGRP